MGLGARLNVFASLHGETPTGEITGADRDAKRPPLLPGIAGNIPHDSWLDPTAMHGCTCKFNKSDCTDRHHRVCILKRRGAI